MDSALFLLSRDNSIFHTMPERYFCMMGVSRSIVLRRAFADEIGYKLSILYGSYKQEASPDFNPVPKFYMSITESFTKW